MTRLRTLALLAAASLALASAALGQVQIASGHALDSSLRLGDGGYNFATQRSGPPLNATRYSAYAGSTRAFSNYTGGGYQNIREGRITNQDVFFNERAYNAGGQRTTTSYAGPPRGGSGGGGGGYNPGAYRITQ